MGREGSKEERRGGKESTSQRQRTFSHNYKQTKRNINWKTLYECLRKPGNFTRGLKGAGEAVVVEVVEVVEVK